MSSASPFGQGQKVPAWKRLGLQLKPAAAPTEPGAAPAAGSQPNGARNQDLGVNASSAAKRKRPDVSAPAASPSPLKKTRLNDNDNHAVARTPTLRKQKSVTFTDDTKTPADANTANGVKTPAKKTNAASPKSKQGKQQPVSDPKPALDYLQNWKHKRDTWKFNKNYQSLLIKRTFDPHALPTDHIEIFYEYIRDLKGGLRQLLRNTARDIRKRDAAEGKGGFPEGTMDVQAKQAEYEEIIAGFLQLGLGAGTKRKRFDEVTFMQGPPEPILAHRVIKRMRAELIDEELTDSDDESEADAGSEAPTTTTEATTVAASEDAAEEEAPEAAEARLDDRARAAPVGDADVKRVRRRKLRVAADDSSSDESSDSESDSDSGSSDSDSSDSDDSDSEEEEGAADDAADDSSDSSDSSDSDSSDSEEEEDDDAEASDSDDSDDSDSDSEDEQPAKAPVATQPKKKVQARAKGPN
ncbi:hypothetical protein B0T11DRAFT_17189 [Plectosphaerella cucumerina]|uniref:WKF domain-containing protein n=1 Tax=Plectosphaerella cucumerina TaxID=40658 RepID=A0A8K0TVN7_9PEZI|nr:hypothetical protein B0T11DRAFT_17189 [Plectosphaerella cucumerina]